MTDGIKRKRDQKRSVKKDELYQRILREHGIDPLEMAQANKLNYDIPPLPLTLTGQKSKPQTPIA